MAPIVVPALRSLDRQLTVVAPRRTLPSWFEGDRAHRLRPSGHNADDTAGSKAEDSDSDSKAEIRAGDYRLPLNATFTAEQFIQWLVKKCRSGEVTWIKYIIFNKRIWRASNGWKTESYNGSNDHSHHFHVSSKSDTKSENTTKDMGMSVLLPKPPAKTEELPVKQSEYNALFLGALKDKTIRAEVGKAMLETALGDAVYPKRQVGDLLRDLAKMRGVLSGDQADTKNAALSPTAPLSQLLSVPANVDAVLMKLDSLPGANPE